MLPADSNPADPASVPTAKGMPVKAPETRSRLQRFFAYRRLLIIGTLVFGLDQLTKAWIHAHLPLGSYGPFAGIEIFPDFLYIVHVGNTGAAWSMFSGKSVFLASLAFLTLAAIYIWRRALGLQTHSTQIAFGLLCGGILGNLVDRILHGHVIDFLDVHFGSYVYPTFNIADSSICVGVTLYLWQSLRNPP